MKTNGDKFFREASDQELAEILSAIELFGFHCCGGSGGSGLNPDKNVEKWLDWVRQGVE